MKIPKLEGGGPPLGNFSHIIPFFFLPRSLYVLFVHPHHRFWATRIIFMGKMKTVQREAIMCHSSFGPAVKTGFMRCVEKKRTVWLWHTWLDLNVLYLNSKTRIIYTNWNDFHAMGVVLNNPDKATWYIIYMLIQHRWWNLLPQRWRSW